MNNLLLGFLYGIFAQVLTFLQLQGSVKYGWYEKYPIIVLATSIPLSWAYIKSVENIVEHYKGEIWPSRLIGFGIGILVFFILSWFLFKEPITFKTLTCLLLACCIIAIQVFWK